MWVELLCFLNIYDQLSMVSCYMIILFNPSMTYLASLLSLISKSTYEKTTNILIMAVILIQSDICLRTVANSNLQCKKKNTNAKDFQKEVRNHSIFWRLTEPKKTKRWMKNWIYSVLQHIYKIIKRRQKRKTPEMMRSKVINFIYLLSYFFYDKCTYTQYLQKNNPEFLFLIYVNKLHEEFHMNR